MPRFAIGLIPIDHPIAVDMRRTLNITTSIRSPDRDALDLDRQVHTSIHVGPALGNVIQSSLVLALPISVTVMRRPGGIPECTMGNTILASLLPSLPLLSQLFPCSVVSVDRREEVVEEDEGRNLGQDD